MIKNNQQRILNQIKEEMKQILEKEFLQKRNGEFTHQEITEEIKSYLHSFLHKNMGGGYCDRISFEAGASSDGTFLISPKNFFTGLLMKGIYYPPALWGLSEAESENGIYKWVDNKLAFFPKSAGWVTIPINITKSSDGIS